MRKKLLLACALILMSINGFSANYNLSLEDLGSGWSSSYDAATQTITFEGDWTGRGWWLGNQDFSGYSDVVIEFETVDYQVKLVVEYNGGVTSGEAFANPGATSVTLALDATGKQDVSQIYIQSGNDSAGKTLKLTAAYVTEGGSSGETVRESLSLDDFGSSGWGDSSYDAATRTITFVADWTGRGWWLEAADYSDYDKVVVTFEPASMQLKLVIEYGDGSNNTPDVYANEGETSMTVLLDSEKKNNVKQIYIQSASAGTVVLTDAYLEGAASGGNEPVSVDFTFDSLEEGDYSQTVGGGAAVTVASDPAKEGKALEIALSNYDSMPTVEVTLPEGNTFSDIISISFDVYATTSDWKERMINVNGTMVYKPGAYPQSLWAGEWRTITITAEEFNESAAEFASLNSFTLGVGLNDNAMSYYLDNIVIELDGTSSIEEIVLPRYSIINFQGGIEVDNNGAVIEVYSIDGRKIVQTTDSRIYLNRGIYIVRVANGEALKTIVR